MTNEEGRAGFLYPREKTVKRVSAGLFNTPTGGCREDGAKLFSGVYSDRTRGNRQKLLQGKLQLDTWKNFFPRRMVKN